MNFWLLSKNKTMDLFELLGEVIGLGCVAFLLYNEGILPRSLNSFFQKVKDGYRKVEAGELSYIAFKEDLRNKCYHRMQIESLQTIRFKEVLLGMLVKSRHNRRGTSREMGGVRFVWTEFGCSGGF